MTNHVSAERALMVEAGKYVSQINAGMTRAAAATVKLAALALREYATRKGCLALASVEARLPGAVKQRLAIFLTRASGGGIQYTRGHFTAMGLRGDNFKVAVETCNASAAALAGAKALPAPAAPAPAPEFDAPAPAPAVEFDATAALARLIKRAEKAGALEQLRAACITFTTSAAPEAPAPAPAAPETKTRRK